MIDSESLQQLQDPISEEVVVEIIKAKLRTPHQKALLDAADLTIPDLLNGRYTEAHEPLVQSIYREWNALCGTDLFGY